MYLEHFKLKQLPFSITPDPAYVYLSEKHQESLAHLIYGVSNGGGAGFVQLTGEVGTGKTTICRLFLQQLPKHVEAALILNPAVTPLELMESLFKELGISKRGTAGQINRMVERLNDHLLEAWANGKTTVIIIDEAQNIPRDTLEHLRLLTNLETDKQKLLQIILIGQPELKVLMQRDDLRQLAQRITSRFHLQPLSEKETASYINHRLKIAGGDALFSQPLARSVYKLTHGTPRLINVLCDRTLLAAYADDTTDIRKKHLNTAVREVFPDAKQPIPVAALAMLGVIVIASALALTRNSDDPEPVTLQDNLAIEEVSQYTFPTTEDAWQSLFSVWNIQPQEQWFDNSCPPLEFTGMGCLWRQGNLTQIKQLNVPVLLELQNRQLLPIMGHNDNGWWLWQDNGNMAVSSQWLNQRWLGHYYVLWPTEAPLWQDENDTNVNDWALDMARTLDKSAQLDADNLSQWILQFQRQNSLISDGIIGKETQMALSLKAYQGPKLNQYPMTAQH
ncbi:ExeA family protein [Marinicella sp. W31]|uniref:ExeA family protein n=1 Tax=Marinicella sp. W31 TaxID=3023713 RepID=UPI003757933F